MINTPNNLFIIIIYTVLYLFLNITIIYLINKFDLDKIYEYKPYKCSKSSPLHSMKKSSISLNVSKFSINVGSKLWAGYPGRLVFSHRSFFEQDEHL